MFLNTSFGDICRNRSLKTAICTSNFNSILEIGVSIFGMDESVLHNNTLDFFGDFYGFHCFSNWWWGWFWLFSQLFLFFSVNFRLFLGRLNLSLEAIDLRVGIHSWIGLRSCSSTTKLSVEAGGICEWYQCNYGQSDCFHIFIIKFIILFVSNF